MNSTINRRVLVIDDNQAIHDDFRKILCGRSNGVDDMAEAETSLFGKAIDGPTVAGFEIDSAFQGVAGLACVEHALSAGRPYAMAFIDVRMPPGWDGIETTERIWKVDPDLQIVICTAYSDYSWNEVIAKVGQSDRLVVLKKPFDNIEASQLALTLTNKWHLTQQARHKLNELGERVRERTIELTTINASLRTEITERKQAEEALRESREHYRNLIESQGEGVVITDLDRRFTFANPAAETILGAWPGQLVGKLLDEFAEEKARAVIEEQFELRRAGKKTSYEIEITSAQGERRQILITGTPQLDAEGRFCGTFAVFRDITQRKKAERALRENQRLLKTILDNIPDPAWLKDAQGRYLVGNKSLAQIYRRGLEEIVGKTVFEVFPQHAPALAEGDSKIAVSGQSVRSENCIPDADGHNRWFDTIETPILNEQNEVTGTAGIARDVTDHREMETAMRESEARYRSLFENMLEGFACCRMIFDQDQPQDFVYLEVNSEFERLTGLKNVIGKKATEVMPGIRQANPELFEIYGRVALTGKPEKFETYVDSLGIWFSVAVSSHQKEHFVVVFDNITERKQMEEDLRQKTALFEAMVNSSPDGILIVNEQGKKVLQNPQFTALVGIPPHIAEDADDTKQLQFVTDSARDPEQFLAKVLHLNAHPEETSQDEIEFKSGRILDRFSAPVRDQNGIYYGRVWKFRDVTERRQMEAALRENEKLLREMGRTAKIGGWELDPATGQGQWTEEVARIHDLEPTVRPDRAMGAAFYLGKSRALIEVAIQEAIDHGTPYDLELEIVSARGKHKWVRTICEPLVENGKVMKLRGSLQDITEYKQAELALLAERDFSSGIIKQMPSIIVGSKVDGTTTFLNPAGEAITGYRSQEIIGRNWWQTFYPEEEYRQVEKLLQDIKNNEVRDYEMVLTTRTGEKRTICWNSVNRRDEAGKIYEVIGFGNDITERKQAEAALQQSESKFRALFENARDAIFILDTHGQLVDVNRESCERLQYSRAELLQMKAQDIDVPESAALVQERIDRLLRVGHQIFEAAHVRRDGTIIPVEINSQLLMHEGQTLVLSFCRDLTERKRTEEKLHLQSSALAAAANGIAITDHKGLILWVNPAFTSLTGYSGHEAIGQTHALLKSGVQDQAFYQQLWDTILSGKVWQGELVNRRKDGRLYHEEMIITPVLDEKGAILNFVAVKQDISQRKQAEKALQEQLALRERLSKIAANVPGFIYAYLLRPDGSACIPYASPTMEEFYGVRAEDVVADASPIFKLIHPDDQAHMQQSMAHSARTLLPWRAEFRVQHPKKGVFWVEGHSTPERQADGSILWHGFMSDITERKRVGYALQERACLAALEAEVGTALTRSGALAEMLRLCSEAIVRHLDGAFVRIWGLNEHEEILELQASAGLYTHLNGPHGRVPVGKFKIGLIAEERKPHLTNQVIGDPRVGDQEWAKREGMVAFAGYPLLVEDRLIGVVAMFARHTLTETTLQALASISKNIAAGMDRKRSEEALLESKRFLQSTLNALSSHIAILDEQGTIVEVNAAWHRFARENGSVGSHGVGDNYLHVCKSAAGSCAEEASPVAIGIRDVMTGKIAEFYLEYPCHSPQEERWFIVRATRFGGAGPVRVVVAHENITERMASEAQIERLRAEHATVLNSLGEGVHWVGVDGRIKFENPASAKMLGYEIDELIGKPAHDTMHHKRADGTAYPIGECGINATLRDGLIRHVTDEVFWRKDGTCFAVEYVCTPVYDKNGSSGGCVVIFNDISQRIRTEQELRAREEAFRALADNVPDAVARIDRDLHFVYGNRALLREIAKENAAFLGKTADELKLPDSEQLRKGLLQVFKTGKANGYEFQWSVPEGDRCLESRLVPEYSSTGEVEFVLTLTRDVSEQKKVEKERQVMEMQLRQAQKMEAVGQLAAGIAHEINTPTQYVGDNTRFLKDAFDSITGLLRSHGELLAAAKENTLTPELLERVEDTLMASDLEYLTTQIPQAISETLEGVERVTKIVRAMKEFSHPGGKEKSMADLNKAIESTTTVARNEWKYVSDLKLDLDPDLPLVPCFVGEFNQVMLNLVVNAAHAIGDVVKQNPETKGTITVQTRRDGDSVEVRVSDTGTGIAEAHRRRVFEPFFTTKDVGHGTGQGLTLVYSTIVKKHGGTVTFETEIGKGTTFIIRLPILPPNVTAEKARPAATENSSPS